MPHAAGSLVCHASGALYLFCGDAVPCRGEHEDRVKPELQACGAGLKQGADHRVDVVAAVVAAKGLNVRKARLAGITPTLWAFMISAEAEIKQVLQTGIIIRALSEKLGYGCGCHFLLLMRRMYAQH